MLKNPCYAGAYVHGRYASRRTVEPSGTVHTGLAERSRAGAGHQELVGGIGVLADPDPGPVNPPIATTFTVSQTSAGYYLQP